MTTNYIKNERDAEKASPKEGQKVTKLPAGDGLFLYINYGGRKTWAREFSFNSISDVIRFGIYPITSVKEAKERNARITVDLLNGIHPKAATLKKTPSMPTLNEFFIIFKEYKISEKQWTSLVTITKNQQLFQKYFAKKLGNLPLNQIDIELLKPIFRGLKKTPENQDKMRTLIKTLFDLAVDENLVQTNPMLFLPKTIITKSANQNFKHVTADFELKEILQNIRRMSKVSFVVHAALKMAPHLFLRPQELLSIRWKDINWNESLIVIQKEANKTRKELLVPISKQVKAMILELLDCQPFFVHKDAHFLSKSFMALIH
ncbi:tyrosine-type recombinase/integrase [Thiomicrorhabdus aquaedulcis]|uniref:tyrosine-type recombinase/integrase n=1 Tax=Thiomicrorhabdus aquaedulcis TaxID=2211106 RepID=UPI000FD6EC50|nr:integrase arm-type DNA-binding domain-containing protein [Thiomicrorhabdus aquaedulcis]